MALDREEGTAGSTAVITANVTDEQLQRSRRTQASGPGILSSSLEADDDERAKIFERYDIPEGSLMDNMPMEELRELVCAFSGLEEDFGMVLTLHAMQLLDVVTVTWEVR